MQPCGVFAGMDYREGCFILAMVLLPVFAIFVYISDEPFSLFDAVSMWPSEMLKLIAMWLSVFLFYRARDLMQANQEEIEKQLNLSGKEGGDQKDIEVIWQRYIDKGKDKETYRRIAPVAYAWLWVCGLLYYVQQPNIPFRDSIAWAVDGALTALTFFGFIFLFAFVTDATMLCRRFIQRLIDEHTEWPGMAIDKSIQDVQREWLETRLIGMRTDDVSRTIYYPVYVILLLLAAHTDYFDNFDMPLSLLLIGSVNIALVLVFSISLRKKALEARATSLSHLAKVEERLRLGMCKSGWNSAKFGDKTGASLSVVDEYQERIVKYREGAFLPISEQPWLRALTLMTGGGSSILLLQYLAG